MTWCTKFPKQAIAVTNGQVEGEVLHMLIREDWQRFSDDPNGMKRDWLTEY